MFTFSISRLYGAVFLCIIPLTNAGDFDECVPVAALSTLLSHGGSVPEVLGRLPDEFPQFQVPKGSELVGSLVYDHYTQVAFTNHSSMPDKETLTSFVRALQDKGWELPSDQPAVGPPFIQRGFRGSRSAVESESLCHKKHGRMSVSVISDTSGSRTMVTQSSQRYSDCRNIHLPHLRSFAIQKYMPNFELPSGASSNTGHGGASAISGSEMTTAIEFEAKQNLSELQRHFAGQLEAQRWMQDANWQGRLSAGSVWESEPEPGTRVAGTLSIIERSPGDFIGQFKLILLDEQIESLGGVAADGVFTQAVKK